MNLPRDKLVMPLRCSSCAVLAGFIFESLSSATYNYVFQCIFLLVLLAI